MAVRLEEYTGRVELGFGIIPPQPRGNVWTQHLTWGLGGAWIENNKCCKGRKVARALLSRKRCMMMRAVVLLAIPRYASLALYASRSDTLCLCSVRAEPPAATATATVGHVHGNKSKLARVPLSQFAGAVCSRQEHGGGRDGWRLWFSTHRLPVVCTNHPSLCCV